ncbi:MULTISPECIES: response regulator [Pseudomonas]|jgi:DNA-binding NtrC family response regulator|uniref:Response regulator receiver protein n=1 Tax=Pseudomonas putida TRO1 TaxID=1227924 RepID=A0AAD2WF68_PSEPU|nr:MULTISPECIES: response regulator [Pseudomonas]AYN18093.1 response regulator [Pseudomonas monteilii]ENY79579.1 response regulator receiver protein [Pseudomonas putida TRO1]MBH3350392.1 response regulator [Pseudomonas putida]UWH21090.1 response regulator [Pseudomonas sp. HD6515]HDS0941391.1 response regulator [Pseudomonas putida]
MTKTILIVEDDELLRDLTAESLSSLYAVTITSTANADEALHHLSHEETPALVMSDIHMPGSMDGLGLAHVIWRRWPTLPVILTSGHAIIDTHSLPVRSAFLPKPWGITDLASLINKLVTLPAIEA